MMVHLKRFKKLFLLVLAIFFSWIAYVSIFLAAVPLSDPNINEIDKKNALGLTTSIETEYNQDGSPFWWITRDGIDLRYVNNTNELVKGQLILAFSGNPCKEVRNLQLKSSTQKNLYFLVEDNQIQKVLLDVSIEPYGQFNINITSNSNRNCYVDNGDTRDFVGKLEGWIFE